MKTNIGLIVGEFCESNKKLIWDKTNFVWINPTKDMSPSQVNEFKNNITDFFPTDEDPILFIWTNDKELIDSISPSKYWRVENGKLFENVKVKDDIGKHEMAARNWDVL